MALVPDPVVEIFEADRFAGRVDLCVELGQASPLKFADKLTT
jgi:hypothetical protein